MACHLLVGQIAQEDGLLKHRGHGMVGIQPLQLPIAVQVQQPISDADQMHAGGRHADSQQRTSHPTERRIGAGVPRDPLIGGHKSPFETAGLRLGGGGRIGLNEGLHRHGAGVRPAPMPAHAIRQDHQEPARFPIRGRYRLYLERILLIGPAPAILSAAEVVGWLHGVNHRASRSPGRRMERT